MVYLSVCPSVTIVSPAKTADPIEMLFGMWTWAGPRNQVLDGSPGPMQSGNFEGGRGDPLYSIGSLCHELRKNG